MAPALIVLAACGGGGGGGGGGSDNGKPRSAPAAIFFAPDQADKLAHAAMPGPAELPGAGWEIAERDAFDDSQNDDEFDKAMANEPACAQLNALGSLGGVLGSGGKDDELPAGRAQVKFENAMALSNLPTSVEVSVEIERTVSEVEGSWGLAKSLFESGQTQDCILAAVRAGLAEAAQDSGMKFDVAPRTVSARSPRGGVSAGYNFSMSMEGVEGLRFDMAMEMYLWPYGNAGVSVLFIGEPNAINSELVDSALRTVDGKVASARESADQQAPQS